MSSPTTAARRRSIQAETVRTGNHVELLVDQYLELACTEGPLGAHAALLRHLARDVLDAQEHTPTDGLQRSLNAASNALLKLSGAYQRSAEALIVLSRATLAARGAVGAKGGAA